MTRPDLRPYLIAFVLVAAVSIVAAAAVGATLGLARLLEAVDDQPEVRPITTPDHDVSTAPSPRSSR